MILEFHKLDGSPIFVNMNNVVSIEAVGSGSSHSWLYCSTHKGENKGIEVTESLETIMAEYKNERSRELPI